jgi:hypothetical protein
VTHRILPNETRTDLRPMWEGVMVAAPICILLWTGIGYLGWWLLGSPALW